MTDETSSESTEQNRSDPTAHADHHREAATLIDALFELGARWAAFGVSVSRQALVQSARTLEQTARTLDALAAEMARKQEQNPPA